MGVGSWEVILVGVVDGCFLEGTTIVSVWFSCFFVGISKKYSAGCTPVLFLGDVFVALRCTPLGTLFLVHVLVKVSTKSVLTKNSVKVQSS